MKPKIGDTVVVRINPDSDLEYVREGVIQSIDDTELEVQFLKRRGRWVGTIGTRTLQKHPVAGLKVCSSRCLECWAFFCWHRQPGQTVGSLWNSLTLLRTTRRLF